jgi:hypothetical protein
MQMHWFWRGTLSAMAGAATFGCLFIPLLDPLILQATGQVGWVVYFALLGLLPQMVSISMFAFLTRLKSLTEGSQAGCRKCGYDLTGNISGTCPECGERI